MSAIVVAKLGGSLLDWPGLPAALGRFLAGRAAIGQRPALVVGGGRVADWVRGFDRIHALGDAPAHLLAIRSLDLTARAVATLMPGLLVVETRAEAESCWASGSTPILAPRRMLDADDREGLDPLPHSWDVTSDAIAARVAVRLGAEELVMLKSVSVPEGASPEEASRLGIVDSAFPDASRRVPRVVFVNLRDPVPSPGAPSPP